MIALPVGIVLGHLHRGSSVAIGASIVGRALPSLVLIGVLLTVLGHRLRQQHGRARGARDGPILTNSYDGVDGVERDVGRGGARDGHVGRADPRRVELPLAVPLIFTGIRIAAVTVVATAPIAAIAGGGGLGDVIVNQASYRLEGVIGASLCVMALSAGVWLALARVAERRSLPGHFAGLGSRRPATDERSSSDQEAHPQGGQGGVRDLPRGRDHPRPIRRHGPAGDPRRARRS